jgi:cation transport ATPase
MSEIGVLKSPVVFAGAVPKAQFGMVNILTAGRVQMETLVAMGSLGAQTAAYGTPATVADGSDDNVVHDA